MRYSILKMILMPLTLALVLGSPVRSARGDDQEVTFDVQPRVLKVGESANCRITITGQRPGAAPSLPPIPGFELAGTSQQQSFSIANGVQQSSVSYIYQLVALEAGTFQIGPFGYERNGTTHSVGPVEITVVAGQNSGTGTASSQEDFLFATLTASQPSAYVQQPIHLELALYWRDLNIDREVGLNGFDTTGLRLGGWQELPVNREAVRGQVFEVRRFRCQAIPLTAGTFALSPSLRVQVLVRNNRAQANPFFGGGFDDLFFGGFRAQPTDVSVPALSLTIRDLPTEGRPPEFRGAVGQFRMEVQAQPRAVGVGEPVTLTARISGPGNPDTVTAPALETSDDFRSYEPKLVGQDAAAESKTFELVLIPKHAGVSNLPAVHFAYFDPQAGRYERIEQPPLPLRVEGQSTATRIIRTAEAGGGAAQPSATGIDITHLKTKVPRWHTQPALAFTSTPGWVALQSVPLLALVGSWWWSLRRHRLRTDQVHARRRQAPHSARKALAEALRCLEKEPAPRFYEALWNVLVSYFGNRFNLAPGEVSAGEVSRRLLAGGWDVARVNEITRLFDACEGSRFGAGAQAGRPLEPAEQQAWRTLLDRLVEHLRACERLP